MLGDNYTAEFVTQRRSASLRSGQFIDRVEGRAGSALRDLIDITAIAEQCEQNPKKGDFEL
jgi:hypothetical protein